jgi:acyl dehydratase
VAHGLLTLSLLPTLVSEVMAVPDALKMGLNYGYDKIRFLAPVRSGKRIRGRFKILELTEIRPGQWRQILEASIEIEGEEKPALVAEWVTLMYV